MCRNNMDEKKKQVQAKTGKIDAYFFHADDHSTTSINTVPT